VRLPPALTRFLARPWLSFAVQSIVLSALVFALGAYQTRKHLRARVAPDFVLPDLSGQRVALADFRGKKVLVHFFATWCGVCRLELPSLRGLAQHLGPDEALVAVVEDSTDVEAVRRFAREHELTYPILLGSPEVVRAYRVGAFPTNYFVNGDGSIASSSVGLSTRLGMATRLWLAHAGGAER
jgi:peroxiredoxin